MVDLGVGEVVADDLGDASRPVRDRSRGHRHASTRLPVDLQRPLGGELPGELAGPVGPRPRRAAPGARRRSTSAAQGGGPVAGRVALHEQARTPRRGRPSSGRRRRRRRPGSRWPGPRRRPGRTTRCSDGTATRSAATHQSASSARGRPAARTVRRRRGRAGWPGRPAPRGGRARSPRGRRRRGPQPRPQLGRLLEQHRDRAQQHVGRLERLDPAGEEQHAGVVGEARATRGRPQRSRGRNTSRSTPGWTTSTRPGSASYRLISCLASRSVLATSMSAAATTCCSPMIRALGLGGVALGERVVLDLRHGVHGVDERHAPAVARSAPTWPESQ